MEMMPLKRHACERSKKDKLSLVKKKKKDLKHKMCKINAIQGKIFEDWVHNC